MAKAKMTVYDFAKKADFDSDDIPVEVRLYDENPSSRKLIAAGKSLYHYSAHGGPEIINPLHSVSIRKDVIVLYVK